MLLSSLFPRVGVVALLTLCALAPACASTADACGAQTFGAPLPSAPALSLDELLREPQQYAGQALLVTGTVGEVCAKKGCWMSLSDARGNSMRVTFRDYGFFVPTDCAGREVRFHGEFAIRDVPADEARHYLEDAGRFEEASRISGPVPSFVFVAEGVELR